MKANNATADAALPKVVGSILIVSQMAIENPLVLTFESYRLQLFPLAV